MRSTATILLTALLLGCGAEPAPETAIPSNRSPGNQPQADALRTENAQLKKDLHLRLQQMEHMRASAANTGKQIAALKQLVQALQKQNMRLQLELEQSRSGQAGGAAPSTPKPTPPARP